MKNKTWIAAVVLIVLVLGSLVCWKTFAPQAVEGEKEITVEISHKDGTCNAYTFRTQQKYLYDALAEQNIIGPLSEGYFTQLDGETANTEEQEWWGYTKSGEMVDYGIDTCPIEDGDHYEFTLNVGW